MKIIQAMRDAEVRARGSPRERVRPSDVSERKSGESLTWVCKKERSGYQRRERGEDYSWNDREEDRVIEGVAGVRGEVCATRTTGGLCAEVARAGWG